MVREFSEEKRQEIFRLLDEIDNREWKSFMEWCGSSAEEFGNWPDKLAVSAYTRYVDKYHERVLEINEMTRNRVNTVFENVAEIDTRYAGRMKDCQVKIKEQIDMVNTMTEFMQSMTDGIPNKAHGSGGGSHANGYRSVDDDEEENTDPIEVIDAAEIFYSGYTETGQQILTQCLIDHNITDSDEINRVLEWTMENDSWQFIELTKASHSDNYNENIEEIFKTIMRNFYADTATGGNLNGKVIEFNCYWVRESFSISDYEKEEFLEYITDLYQNGYVSEKDYISICNLMKAVSDTSLDYLIRDVLREKLEEHLNHVVTTVYIYNCLQVLAGRTITPEECCKVNEIFRYFGITDRDSIACFLICCAGESDGFTSIQENYEENDNYSEDESGIGYLQVTSEETQKACLEYIHEIYEKGELIENQGVYKGNLIDYPWTASAWYWAIYPKVDVDGGQPLNIYVMDRLEENRGKLTLGIVLTAECFVHGDVDSKKNIYRGYTIDDALHVIARYDSLRLNDEKNNGGWYVVQNENNNKDCTLYIPAEMLEIKENEDGTLASDIPSVWNASEYLKFTAPHNWKTFEDSYNKLYAAGLIDFDLNTDLP